jgi:hypothetical protein
MWWAQHCSDVKLKTTYLHGFRASQAVNDLGTTSSSFPAEACFMASMDLSEFGTTKYSLYFILLGGLEHGFYDFRFSWECHHPS